MALTVQQQAIQNQINAFDSNTGTQLLLSTLLQAINVGDVRQGYADSAAFPTDSAFIGMIGFDDFDSSLRFVGRDLVAHKIDSADIVVSGGGASGPIAYAGTNVYVYHDDLQKFNMTSSSNAAVVITGPFFPGQSREASGGRSSTHGYFAGGGVPSATNTVYRFPFAAEDALSDTTADLTQVRYAANLDTIGDGLFNYVAGGFNPGIGSVDTIDKYPTSNTSNATDVGNLTDSRYSVTGQSSSTHGYRSGGLNPSTQGTNIIDKFAFAADGNATDVGDTTLARGAGGGASSTTHGYQHGGIHIGPPVARYNRIDKFAFASDGNATDVGDLTGTDHDNSGGSSSTHGFRLGGSAGTPTGSTDIEKWSFSSDENASDVADLTENVKQAGTAHDTA